MLSYGSAKRFNIKRVSTGSIMLDKAIGGGIPYGRFSLFYGSPMSGKTTIALSTIANAQKEGAICAYLDTEKTYDLNWAAKLGIDTDKLLVSNIAAGEPVVDTLADLVEKRIDLVVVDSIAAMCPKEFLMKEAADVKVAPLAKLINEMMSKVNALNSKTAVIFINQPREAIGKLFGSTLSLPGGKSIGHYSSVNVKFWVAKRIKDNKEDVIAREVHCEVEKNKLAPPFRSAQFNLYFDGRIDNNEELLRLAIEQGVVKKNGSWYAYKEEKIQGDTSFIEECNGEWRQEVSIV